MDFHKALSMQCPCFKYIFKMYVFYMYIFITFDKHLIGIVNIVFNIKLDERESILRKAMKTLFEELKFIMNMYMKEHKSRHHTIKSVCDHHLPDKNPVL